MKILNNKREGNKVFLEVEEDYKNFQSAEEKALARASKEINIPGFRPGKAPVEMVRQTIEPEYIESRAAQELISDLYPEILEQTKIDPVDFPKVDIVTLKKGQPFVFKIEVEVYPEVKLGKYKGLKLEKNLVEVSEDEVMRVLGSLANRMAKTGADGKKEEIAIDDEFAKKISRHGTLAELKAEALEAMQKEKASESESDLKNKAIAAVSGDAVVDIPSGMVEREINVMLDELKNSLVSSNLTLEDYLKGIKKEEGALREELKKSAEIRVKGKVILKAVAEAESIKVDAKEMDEELTALAAASGREPGDFKNNIDEGTREFVQDYVLRRKALDFIIEKARITEVKSEPEKPKEDNQ